MASLTSFSKDTLQPTQTPFRNIGLAFSGGGFRAASYCLGTLAYFNEVSWGEDEETLLHRVSYISSASGGTITNATYALSVAYKKSFGEFYAYLFSHLEGVKLLTRVFEILNDDRIWKEADYHCKRRNLINAFAIAYDQLLFSWPGEPPAARLEALMTGNPDGPLDEVCFNTTEFYRGVLFRQAVKLKPDEESPEEFLYGNYLLNVLNGVEKDIRLADALAASSCFPAGFEPLVFPTDFATGTLSPETILRNTCIQPQELKWPELHNLLPDAETNALLKHLGEPFDVRRLRRGVLALEAQGQLDKGFETGFMDGGIDDNQGIDSLMRANARREQGKKQRSQAASGVQPPEAPKKYTRFQPFDLMMTNDVGSHYMDPYKPMPKKVHTGYLALSLRTVRWGALGLGVLGVLLIVAALIWLSGPWEVVLAILGTIVALLFGGVFGMLTALRRFIRGRAKRDTGLNLERTFSKGVVKQLLHFFGGTPLGVLQDMIKDRAASVLTLNNDVFLKRIRQLLYERILDEGRGCFRMKTNHVYDLAYSNDLNRLRNDTGEADLCPTPAMQILAQCAFEMGTTLWFNPAEDGPKDHSQAALIATGQFTTCYNLLLFIHRMKEPHERADGRPRSYYDGLAPDWQDKVDFLQLQMEAHYKTFREDPFWLYNKLGAAGGSDFKPATLGSYPFPKKLFNKLRPNDRSACATA